MQRFNRKGDRKHVKVTKMQKVHGCRCGGKKGPCSRYKEVHKELKVRRNLLKKQPSVDDLNQVQLF